MSENVGSIEYDARINTANLKKDGAEVESTAKNTGDAIDKGIGDGVKKAGIAMAAVGTALTIVAKKATDFTVDYVKDANSLAREIGGTAEESSRLLFVTSRLGLETENTRAAFGIYSKNIIAAKDASAGAGAEQIKLTQAIEKTKLEITQTSAEIKKHGDKSGELGLKIRTLNTKLQEQESQLSATRSAFDKIGVSVVDAQGKQKGFTQILLETSDKFKDLPAGAEKTALAMELFGRSGKDLIPLLNLGSQGIQDLEKRADELGLTLNQKTIGAVAKYIESSKQLKESTDAMKIAIGTATAPVLTAFNTKVSDIIRNLLATDGPLKTVTTNVLAFGGPILGATGALTSFGANALTVGSSLRSMGVTMAAVATFMTGPWVTGIALAVLAVAGLVAAYVNLTGGANQLKAAHDRVIASQAALTLSQTNLAAAQLSAEGAALNVEAAQNRYNDAVARYGPASLEARQANNDLQQAILAKKDAEDKASGALAAMQKAEQDYAKDKAFEESLAVKADKVKGLQGLINELTQSVKGVDMPNLPNAPNGVGLQQRLRNAFGGARAGGGPVSAGKSYIVGEEQPELFVPRTSGTIVPEVPGGAGSNQNISLNVNISGIMSRSKADERDIAKNLIRRVNEELAAKNVPILGGGAI